MSFAILAVVSVWEVVLIFPLNDRIKELDRNENLSEQKGTELKGLLAQWSQFHIARFLLPAMCAIITAGTIIV